MHAISSYRGNRPTKPPTPPARYTLTGPITIHCAAKLSAQCNEKALRETQTLLAGCSKAEPKIFRPAADPLPEGAGRPKFNQLEMVTTFTYRPSLVKIDARNFELSW